MTGLPRLLRRLAMTDGHTAAVTVFAVHSHKPTTCGKHPAHPPSKSVHIKFKKHPYPAGTLSFLAALVQVSVSFRSAVGKHPVRTPCHDDGNYRYQRLKGDEMNEGKSGLLKPTSDVVFKTLMTQGDDILKSFLAAALDLDADELSALSVYDPHISTGYKDAKMGVLDVRAKTTSGVEIDIEIQLVNSSGLIERIVFYLCSLFVRQIKRGENYARLNRTISIIITGFHLTCEDTFANYYTLRNDVTSTQLSDIIQICTLELPKLKETDTGVLSDWMRFLTVNDESEFEAFAAKDAGIRKAVEMLKYLSEEETLQFLEMSHEKYEWDMANRMADARDEGAAEGTLQVARAALLKGLDIGIIRDITGLDAEAIGKLQEN
jgi:predicted transposase/invertase (TIGR01784 family)